MKLQELIKKLKNTKNVLQYGLKDDIKQLDNINYGIVTFLDPRTKLNDLYAFIFNQADSNEIYGFTRFTNENLYQYLYAIEEEELNLKDILLNQVEKNNNLNYLFEIKG